MARKKPREEPEDDWQEAKDYEERIRQKQEKAFRRALREEKRRRRQEAKDEST